MAKKSVYNPHFLFTFTIWTHFFIGKTIRLELPDADIVYFPNFFDKIEADKIFIDLLENTAWQQDSIKIYGKTHLQPRLTALYGNEGKPYSYSNIKMYPHNWTLLLQKIKFHIGNCRPIQISHPFYSIISEMAVTVMVGMPIMKKN